MTARNVNLLTEQGQRRLMAEDAFATLGADAGMSEDEAERLNAILVEVLCPAGRSVHVGEVCQAHGCSFEADCAACPAREIERT